jgi:hypothetical protein
MKHDSSVDIAMEVSVQLYTMASLPQGWVGLRTGLDDMKKIKLFLALPGLELLTLWSSIPNKTLYRLSYPSSSVIIIIIQLNYFLFMCRVNSHKANYRHSTV